MRILLHACCGPCAVYPLDYLRGEGHEVHGYFFNPNIHPYTEYARRQEALARLAAAADWPVIFAAGGARGARGEVRRLHDHAAGQPVPET
jgi:predicted adenine nucleotide alpha hydrolase (AANH) superfamily ATPase